MTSDDTEKTGAKTQKLKDDEILSFKPVGRPIAITAIAGEFELMKSRLKKPLTGEVAMRIAQKSGTHLLKLISPRAGKGDSTSLYFPDAGTNSRPALLPSTNAPDIPFCKVVYRPLEVIGSPSRSVMDYVEDAFGKTIVEHTVNPEDVSHLVLDAFASVFGADVLDALKVGLLDTPKQVTALGIAEFPIIFAPNPEGGDLQITPISPAASYNHMREIKNAFFAEAKATGGKTPRGRWSRQAVSSKPQNISGAIGGPRVRFLATMPRQMQRSEAELYRFVNGGRFPRWNDEDVRTWVLNYADMLEARERYINQNMRVALDRTADRLIRDAADFIASTIDDAKDLAESRKIEADNLSAPSIGEILHRLFKPKSEDSRRAGNALSGDHFKARVRHFNLEKAR